MKRTRIHRSKGSALIEVALIIALVAMIALPAVRTAGRNATKPMCAYLIGIDSKNMNPGLAGQWAVDAAGNTSCTFHSMLPKFYW